ncbi:MAG TPA: LysE family transporter [Chitinophagaceae bacterium]|jgi:threonine/homoserine/homoserine lactone efflux protein|nr:LysE family transporter [Chitinophagaceae bacterium]
MIEALLEGLALGFILTLSVGPVLFTIIKQSINHGKEGGFSFVAGVWISDLLLVVITNSFSGWVTEMLEYKQAIGFVGSLFLAAMGVYFVFFKKVKTATLIDVNQVPFSGKDIAQLALSGFMINTLNPAVILFWLLNATAFAVTHSTKQRILIFLICLAFNILADVAKVLMAGKLRHRLTVHNIRIINKISGTILICFGLALLYGAIFMIKS